MASGAPEMLLCGVGHVGEDLGEFWFGADMCLLDADLAGASVKDGSVCCCCCIDKEMIWNLYNTSFFACNGYSNGTCV